jgi:hypothetical protein
MVFSFEEVKSEYLVTAFCFVAAQHGLKYRVNTGQIKRYLLQCNKLGVVF